MSELLDEAYWTNRYKTEATGWDIGHPGPLATILDSIENKEAKILIPGAGNGYEAEYAFQLGFSNLHVLDISEDPLKNLQKRVPEFPSEKLHREDFFAHEETYDFILEQTFFCALPPSIRSQYVDKMHQLLAPNGILTGIMFNFPLDNNGPAFGGSQEEYESLFSAKFDIEIMTPCEFSIPKRMGRELYVKFRKK